MNVVSEKIPVHEMINTLNYCVIIPAYNNEKTLNRVITEVLAIVPIKSVIVVNDGSTDSTSEILSSINQEIAIITHEINLGKGEALKNGFKYALENGFENAITIDSDGQHFANDISLFLEKAKENPGALIMGSRNMEQEGVPNKSSFGNKFSNFWFKIETGISLTDTQTGFRLYPLKPISKINLFTSKFETEIEVIVKLAWKNVHFISLPIRVLYDPEERVSHFRPFRDFTRISILNTYLVTLTLLYYLPIRVLKSIKREAIKADESNLIKALSIGFGVFMGIFPIWGFQLLVGILLAILFKLNKVLFVTSANISLPPMIPFIIYFSYLFGSPFFENTIQLNAIENITLSDIHLNFMQYFVGAVIFATVAAIVAFLVSFVLLKLIRKNR